MYEDSNSWSVKFSAFTFFALEMKLRLSFKNSWATSTWEGKRLFRESKRWTSPLFRLWFENSSSFFQTSSVIFQIKICFQIYFSSLHLRSLSFREILCIRIKFQPGSLGVTIRQHILERPRVGCMKIGQLSCRFFFGLALCNPFLIIHQVKALMVYVTNPSLLSDHSPTVWKPRCIGNWEVIYVFGISLKIFKALFSYFRKKSR